MLRDSNMGWAIPELNEHLNWTIIKLNHDFPASHVWLSGRSIWCVVCRNAHLVMLWLATPSLWMVKKPFNFPVKIGKRGNPWEARSEIFCLRSLFHISVSLKDGDCNICRWNRWILIDDIIFVLPSAFIFCGYDNHLIKVVQKYGLQLINIQSNPVEMAGMFHSQIFPAWEWGTHAKSNYIYIYTVYILLYLYWRKPTTI